MAIGECPDCKGQVSKQAAFCPHCGHPGLDRNPVSVNVRDLDMSFGNMVGFLVKAAIAAIPALIILFFISAFIGAALFGSIYNIGK